MTQADSADFMLLAPRLGDQARLAASGCEDQATTRFEHREEGFKRYREVLARISHTA
jgi:hypothetical protein